MSEGEQFVLLTPRDLSDIRGRVHHLALHLSKSNSVLFVEAQESAAFLLRTGKLQKLLQGVFKPLGEADGFRVFTPLACLPFDGSSELINKLNSALLRWQLKRLLKKIGFHDPIVLYYMPNYHRLVGTLGERAAIYDLVDERAALAGRHRRYFDVRERTMMSKCASVIVVSQKLLDEKRRLASRIALIPNGVDAAFFSKGGEPPTELRGLPRPMVGYSGAIDEWFDFEIVEHLARSRPDWSFVLVGPVRTNAKRLTRFKNVSLLGGRRYRDLPSYLAAFDCGIVPHKLTRFRLYSDPLKVYEYIAAGKPVVSTAIPSVERFGELVRVAHDPEGFLRAIEQEIEQDSPERAERRRKAIREHDWKHRVMALSAEVSRIIDEE